MLLYEYRGQVCYSTNIGDVFFFTFGKKKKILLRLHSDTVEYGVLFVEKRMCMIWGVFGW